MKTLKEFESPVLLPEIDIPVSETKRPISPGAEKWLGVPIKCLDHGFVYLKDYMGNDLSIEEAARISYLAGTRKASETEGLIRYLRRHDHTTPFEMTVVKFHAKMPIFVARQWVRHRMASINEESARYSILSNEFYIPAPEVLAEQSRSNRQGREKPLSPQYAEEVRSFIAKTGEAQYAAYEFLLNDDDSGNPIDPERPMLARETSRGELGTKFYTQWYWKTDLHNFMHFARLRMDEHAQYEIRVYANALARVASDAFPIAWKAFEDYELFAKRFTRPELTVLTNLAEKRGIRFSLDEIIAAAKEANLTNKRERNEMIDKLKELGLVNSQT